MQKPSRVSPKGSPRSRGPRLGHLAVLGCFTANILVGVLGSASTADACDIVPAADGTIGVWVLAPPTRASSLEQLSSMLARNALSSTGPTLWRGQRIVSANEPTLPIGRFPHAFGDSSRRVVMGSALRVDSTRERSYLLLRLDGRAILSADSNPIWKQEMSWGSRSGWQVVPLDFQRGDHTLQLAIEAAGKDATLSARLLDQETFAPPSGIRWIAKGTSDDECSGLGESVLAASVRWSEHDGELLPELTIAAPSGLPRNASIQTEVNVSTGASMLQPADPQRMTFTAESLLNSPSVSLLDALPHDPTWPERQSLRVSVRLGTRTLTAALGSTRSAREALREAFSIESSLPRDGFWGTAETRTTLIDTLRVMRTRLLSALDEKDWRSAAQETQRLSQALRAVNQQKAPWLASGIHEISLRSSTVDFPDRALIHVPLSYGTDPTQRYPLVVALHGYDGSPDGILGAFIDASVDSTARPNVDGFVLAPNAYGNTFYRGAGERIVLDWIDWALATYPIDPRKVSITGVSMGGTGTTHLGLRYAERFSALASLCGYQSFFVRQDTEGGPNTDWERSRMHHWSPASWAANGAGLGLFLARGTQDTPLSHTSVLQQSYATAGLRARAEWPSAGHRLWPVVYSNARMWPWLTAFRRADIPGKVVLTTDSLRYGKRDWLQITKLERTGNRATVVAEQQSDGRILVATQGIVGLSLSPPRGATATTLEVDGVTLHSASSSNPIALSKDSGTWREATTPNWNGQKRAELEGPIRDAFLDKLLFVYGTLEPRTRRSNREIAQNWADGGNGVTFDYPVIADTDLTERQLHDASLFLVGTEQDHLLLKRWREQLPIGSDRSRLRLGDSVFDYPQVGALFIYPNPEGPHYVVVLTAPSLAGLWKSLSLPKLLPDYIVWDERLAPAAGRQLLGAVPAVAAGLFEEDWSLPAGAGAP